MNMKAVSPLADMGNVKVYEEPKKNHDYIMTVDVAKGRGQDYSTFNIIDISTNPFKQVACYRNNMISPVKMLSFGGDHSVSYPLLKAHAKKYGPVALVQFDAPWLFC